MLLFMFVLLSSTFLGKWQTEVLMTQREGDPVKGDKS